MCAIDWLRLAVVVLRDIDGRVPSTEFSPAFGLPHETTLSFALHQGKFVTIFGMASGSIISSRAMTPPSASLEGPVSSTRSQEGGPPAGKSNTKISSDEIRIYSDFPVIVEAQENVQRVLSELVSLLDQIESIVQLFK